MFLLQSICVSDTGFSFEVDRSISSTQIKWRFHVSIQRYHAQDSLTYTHTGFMTDEYFLYIALSFVKRDSYDGVFTIQKLDRHTVINIFLLHPKDIFILLDITNLSFHLLLFSCLLRFNTPLLVCPHQLEYLRDANQ